MVGTLLAASPARVRAAELAVRLSLPAVVVHQVLAKLQEQGAARRRTDQRGRVWWLPDERLPVTRKERLLFALARHGELTTDQLLPVLRTSDRNRARLILAYYRRLGIIGAVDKNGERAWTSL